MTRRIRIAPSTVAVVTAILASPLVRAHSASDAYLTLNTQPPTSAAVKTVIHGQWDVALRDLDFVLKLDDNGDGTIKWGELRKHQTAITEYVYAHIRLSGDGKACEVLPTRQMVDNHADGAYAALLFNVICEGTPRRLTLDYQLFFNIDPSHRAIFVFQNRGDVATAVLSPSNSRIDLEL
jgi:hypothetical protein